MKGRTSWQSSDPVEGEHSVTASRSGSIPSRHGGKHGVNEDDPWMGCVLDSENLKQAWKGVKANGGAPGLDGMTVEDFPAFARANRERLCLELREGRYRPAAVRRVFIPKPDGTERPLGIPTVLDRVIQQAIAQVLTAQYDGEFSDHSYGFREGRNAHQAVQCALSKRWLEEQGVPELRSLWIALHYGKGSDA